MASKAAALRLVPLLLQSQPSHAVFMSAHLRCSRQDGNIIPDGISLDAPFGSNGTPRISSRTAVRDDLHGELEIVVEVCL